MLQAISLVLVLLSIYFGFLALKRPGYAFALILSLYAFEQVLQGSGIGFFVARSSLLNIAFGGVACLAIVSSFLRNGMKIPNFPKAATFAYLLFLFAFLSLSWSIDTKISMEWAKAFLPYAILFTFLVPLCITDQKDVRDAISASLLLGFFVGLGMALSSYGHRGIVLDTIKGRDIEANPLAAGNYGGYVAIMAIFSIYSKPKKANWPFMFKVVVALLGIYVLFRSGSRGQIIATILSVMFWLPVVAKVAAKRSTIIALILATAVLVGLTYLVAHSENSVRWKADSINEGLFGRFYGGGALVMYAASESPLRLLFGLGNCSSFAVLGWYPHFVPLEVLGEEGLIGFVLLLLFIFNVYRDGYRVMKMPAVESESRIHIGVLLSLFTFELILSCKQGCLLISPGAGMFCVGLALSWPATSIIKVAKKRQAYEQHYDAVHFQSSQMSR